MCHFGTRSEFFLMSYVVRDPRILHSICTPQSPNIFSRDTKLIALPTHHGIHQNAPIRMGKLKTWADPVREGSTPYEEDFYAFRPRRCSEGAVDCCGLTKSNCPISIKAQFEYNMDGKMAKISLKALCDRDLYVWH